MSNFFRSVSVLVMGFFLAGCDQPKAPAPSARSPSETTAPQQPTTGALAIGSQAPEIEGVDIEGKNFKLSDYRGKVVVLDFWFLS